ncbi:MAG: AMP-binding protein [Burkholderiales bacterium]
MNVAHLLVAAARVHPERPAISVGATQVRDYRQFIEHVARLAASLRALGGDRSGERVVVVATNSTDYIEVMWATWFAGLCIVPVNARLHPKEIAYILEHAGAALLFVSADLESTLGPVASATPTLKRMVVFGSREHEHLCTAAPIAMHPSAALDPAWLFYTSGTTGRPKGATLTHHNLLQMTLRNYADIDAIGADDAILHGAPLSHASGLFALYYAAKGANQVIPESHGFDEQELVELIARHPNSMVFLAPTMLNRFSAHPASANIRRDHLKTIIYGGAPMYLEDLKRALARFGPCMWQGYGQGETPNTISYLSKAWHARTDHPRYDLILGSVGVPRTGIAVRVVDADDRDMPIGEIGEVIVQSEVTMTGYWNNPEASARALKGGWLHTGDLGVFDEHGFLSLKDRSKDVIISGGSNIYPREVEEVLLQHADILEASVIGRPSKEWGEEVIAFVVQREGVTVDQAALDALCLANIARFKRPKAYYFVANLPKSNYGKILKTELRERARQIEQSG